MKLKDLLPKNNQKPLVYWFFWLVLFAICFGLAIFAWNNIAPYQAVMVKIFKLPTTEPDRFFQILWFRINLSTSWLMGAVAWAVLQGFQVSYLLITLSEKALDYLIKQSNAKGTHAINETDINDLKFAKRRFNGLPLASLTYLKVARTVCYVIEFFVGLNSFPLVNGGWWELISIVFTAQFNQIRFDNLVMILILMFAVENLLFAAIMIYKVIEVFKESKAYKQTSESSS